MRKKNPAPSLKSAWLRRVLVFRSILHSGLNQVFFSASSFSFPVLLEIVWCAGLPVHIVVFCPRVPARHGCWRCIAKSPWCVCNVFCMSRIGLVVCDHRESSFYEALAGTLVVVDIFFFFFFFINSTLSLSSFWTSRGHRCHPFSSPVLAFNFYRA